MASAQKPRCQPASSAFQPAAVSSPHQPMSSSNPPVFSSTSRRKKMLQPWKYAVGPSMEW